MGNFYVSITVRSEAPPLLEELRQLSRVAHVAILPDGFCIVCDRQCDMQEPKALEQLAATLSSRLNTAALGILNHDDDVLLCGLFEKGALVQEYGWAPLLSTWKTPPTPRVAFAAEVHRAFRTEARDRPRMRWTGIVGRHIFAVLAHADLAADLGMPSESVGLGWRYVDRGEFSGRGIPFVRIP